MTHGRPPLGVHVAHIGAALDQQQHDVLCPAAHGVEERRPPAMVRQPHLCRVGLHHCTHQLDMAPVGRHHDGRDAARVGVARVDARLQEAMADVQSPQGASGVKRVSAPGVQDVGTAPEIQQRVDQFDPPIQARPDYRREALDSALLLELRMPLEK
jgi:hypothetical protein